MMAKGVSWVPRKAGRRMGAELKARFQAGERSSGMGLAAKSLRH